MPEACLATRLLDPRDDLGTSEIVDIGDCDRSAFARQQLANRLADAGCAAGHQCDLALNLPCHIHSRCCSCLSIYLITAGPGSGTATSTTRSCTRSDP